MPRILRTAGWHALRRLKGGGLTQSRSTSFRSAQPARTQEGVPMTGTRGARRAALIALLLALAALLVAPATASAAPGQVVKVDATGAVFDCGQVTYTPTGGTLTSSADNLTYTLAGAGWFGGNLTAGGTSNFIDTEYFNILSPSGGVVARVAVTSVFVMNAQGVVTVD